MVSFRERPLRRPRTLSLLAAATGAAATLVVTLVDSVRFAYRSPSLHLVLETADTLVALLVAYLVYGRFRQHRRVQDGLLVTAAVVLAAGNVAFSLLPRVAGEASGLTLRLVTVRLLGAALIAVAAATPRRRTTGAPPLVALAAWLAVPVVLTVLVVALGQHLPLGAGAGDAVGAANRPSLADDPATLLAQVVNVALYAVAAALFTRKAEHSFDELLRWVGAACALSAFARLHYLLFPPLSAQYVYSGDLLRSGYYLLLLVGALEEIRSYWSARAQAATLEERRRIARDLHDGLTQELTYLWGQLRQAGRDPAALVRASHAAERALDESRRALAALTRPVEEPLAVTLRQAAEEVAGRYGALVESALAEDVTASHDDREQLVRIVREAVGNAVRHAGVDVVHLTLTRGPAGPEILVQDHGQGFDPAQARSGAFGLVSMRERAEAMDARLEIETVPRAGTCVRVAWDE